MNFDLGKLSGEFVILGAFVVLSYFTHVGWWALTGLTFFISLMLNDVARNKIWTNIGFFAALGFFLAGLFNSGWKF